MKCLQGAAVIAGIGCIVITMGFTWQRVLRAKADPALMAGANLHLQVVTLPVKGMERRALIHLPPSYDPGLALPLVIMFHDAGGTPEAAIQETGWVTKADLEGFIVVFPEASRPDMTLPPQPGLNPPAWNDGSGQFHAGERNVPDVAFIAALLGHLEKKFAVDRQRVFATGFSSGASMAFRVGRELSEHFAAIAPVSGRLWPDRVEAARPVSLLYITGTEDPLNPMESSQPKEGSGLGFPRPPDKAGPPVRENASEWAELIGAEPLGRPVTVTPEGITTVIHGGGRGGTEAVFTTIRGHGHMWPGARSLLPGFMVGTATSRISATDVIWDFFTKHPKAGIEAREELSVREARPGNQER